MAAAGLVIKEEPYSLNVPRSQRGGEIIEPMVSTQWFVRIKPLAEAALEAVRDGRIRIVPERFTKVYYNWLENIQDWCISRQLWWGHRIPVWYCQECGATIVARQDPAECPDCRSVRLEQDPDVLDTWFSSVLWPFSTLGWPEDSPDYRYFYPTSVLETGYDILFFWVARMIMMGLEFTGQVPFHTVYLHGLIRDEHGQKMSKSKGNVIDPLIVMDDYGTDALRFTLLVGSTPGNDMNLSIKKVESNRNFANKVWNAGRFVLGTLAQTPAKAETKPTWTPADCWVQARLRSLVRDVDRLFATYQYGEAGRLIYEFFWSEFADWYVEVAKLQLAEGGDRAFYTVQTLVRVLDTSLRLLHPFTPFVTEELWGHLRKALQAFASEAGPEPARIYEPAGGWEDALILARWPLPEPKEGWEDQSINQFALVMDLVRAIRNARVEKKVPPSKRIPATIVASDRAPILQQQVKTLASLAGLDPASLDILEELEEKPAGQTTLVVSGLQVFLPLEEMVDKDEERIRLQAEMEEISTQVNRLEALLAGPFAQKAPAAVVQKERQKLASYQETLEKLKDQLSTLHI
jgi:valyl-tRNA synthetase